MAPGESFPEARLYAGRRVLVVGGTGFLGSNLTAALAGAGADILSLSRGASKDSDSARDGVVQAIGDIGDDRVARRVVSDRDVIFNVAGRSGAAASNAAPLADLHENARANLVLLEACRSESPNARLVFASTRLVYGPTRILPVRESAIVRPLSLYAVHKLAVEHYLRIYAESHGLSSVALRITNPYGPGARKSQPTYNIVNWFIDLALNNEVLPIYGDGRQMRDYIHVDDVSRAFLLAGLADRPGSQVLNIGSSVGVSFRGMAELVVRAAKSGQTQFVPWPPDARTVETGSFVADIAKAKRSIGWYPSISFETGIANAVIGRGASRRGHDDIMVMARQ